MSNGARSVANDLHEALKALQACRDLIIKNAFHHGCDADYIETMKQTTRVLDKYPNLK